MATAAEPRTRQLARLGPADIPEVMRIERLPGYEAFVGRWEHDEHAAVMASPEACYLGFREGARLAGFIIVTKMDQPSILLRRIAVAEPDRGVGTALLRAVMDWLFTRTPARALELDVALENPRAKHVYEREGFAEDRPPDEIHYYLSIPRERWQGLRNNG